MNVSMMRVEQQARAFGNGPSGAYRGQSNASVGGAGRGGAVATVGASAPASLANAPGNVSFSDVLSEAIDGVRTAFKASGDATEAALLGRGTPHQAMIAMSKAGLSFRFMTQTRNKVVDAYREMMNIQV